MRDSFKQGEQTVTLPIEVGGHTLQMNCIGEEGPTIVLESGLGFPGSSWFNIANEVSLEFTCLLLRSRRLWKESA